VSRKAGLILRIGAEVRKKQDLTLLLDPAQK